MAPPASPVWEWLVRAADAPAAGNQKASCKGCGKTATQAPAQWWPHLRDCDGSSDKEVAAHAKTAAEKHFTELDEAAKKASRSSKTKQTTIVNLTQDQRNQDADEAIARWVFASGQPLLAVDDYYLREAFKKVAAAGPNRAQLGRKRLKEQLLPAEVKRVKRQQQAAVDLEFQLYGRTLVSDGWQDANGRPLINVLLVSPSGEMFQKAIDTSGNRKSMVYIADQLASYVTLDVDFVVMDGACAGAIEILTERFPWLSGVVCATHSLDLLMKDLGSMAFAADPLAAARDLVKFINGHQKTRALLAKESDVVLLSPSATRFGYNLIMIERMLRCEDSLRSTVASREWRDWRRDQTPDIRDHAV